MPDDELLTLAQHRFDQADRDGATHEDCRQLRDIFPAVLQRLRDKVEITRELSTINPMAVRNPNGWEKQAASSDVAADDDQMQLSLLHL
ncbi:hypothetical protein [Novosphingobium resinovorum]|uniref:hypothetical protein n=1 Tax=Novosphingobium resinovorum TaxID=158500 RepID=UPI002ED17EBC|nr:hypothetical protein [Novosphingobium resinovorum]